MSLTKTREIFAMLKREKSAGSTGMVYSCVMHESTKSLLRNQNIGNLVSRVPFNFYLFFTTIFCIFTFVE